MILENFSLIDKSLFIFLNAQFSSLLLNYFFVSITDAHFWIIPAVIAGILFVKSGKKQAMIVLGLALVTIAISDPVSSQIVKPIFERHRPCHPEFLLQGAHILLGFKNSDSFPSSHATNMFALAMLFTLFYPKKWIYFFSFACLIGFSRIYVGVHYPGDVLGGACLGGLIGWGVFRLYNFSFSFFKKRTKPLT